MDNLFVFGSQYLIFIFLLIAGIYFLTQSWSTKKKIVVFGVYTLVLTGILGILSNHIYINPRPFVVGHFVPLIPHDPDNGFPSDHILVTAGISAIVFVFNRKMGIVLGLIALLIAVSRVYVGVHHVLDVTAGFIMAILSAWIVYVVLRPMKKEAENK